MTSRATRRFLFWLLPAAIGLAAAAIFAVGAGAALNGTLGTPVGDAPVIAPTPAPPSAAGTLRVVALGDSLTHGTGDSPAGGYPRRVVEALRKGERPADLVNFGIDGLESDGLLRKLAAAEVREAIAAAGLILLSIGGNDLTHSLPSTPAGTALGDPTAPALARLRENLGRILEQIRAANPAAPIRIVGLYNPFTEQAADRRTTREALLRWNSALEETSFTVPGALVVPTFDLFEERADRLSPDRFHPGPSGYAEIATRVLSSLPAPLLTAANSSRPAK
ncbi:MAG: GDSL-type esterase/lipase family protein [Thermoanaerobaculia bacterium]